MHFYILFYTHTHKLTNNCKFAFKARPPLEAATCNGNKLDRVHTILWQSKTHIVAKSLVLSCKLQLNLPFKSIKRTPTNDMDLNDSWTNMQANKLNQTNELGIHIFICQLCIRVKGSKNKYMFYYHHLLCK